MKTVIGILAVLAIFVIGAACYGASRLAWYVWCGADSGLAWADQAMDAVMEWAGAPRM